MVLLCLSLTVFGAGEYGLAVIDPPKLVFSDQAIPTPLGQIVSRYVQLIKTQ